MGSTHEGRPGERSFEIAVIRADNEHGKKSYGWFGPDDKRLISQSGGPSRDPIDDRETWDLLVGVARREADRLNGLADCTCGAPKSVSRAQHTMKCPVFFSPDAPEGRLDPDEWIADWDGKEWYLGHHGTGRPEHRGQGRPPENVVTLLEESSPETLWSFNVEA